MMVDTVTQSQHMLCRKCWLWWSPTKLHAVQQQNSFKAYFIPLLNSLDEAVIDGTCKHR